MATEQRALYPTSAVKYCNAGAELQVSATYMRLVIAQRVRNMTHAGNLSVVEDVHVCPVS